MVRYLKADYLCVHINTICCLAPECMAVLAFMQRQVTTVFILAG
jgi:hypothetical protein